MLSFCRNQFEPLYEEEMEIFNTNDDCYCSDYR